MDPGPELKLAVRRPDLWLLAPNPLLLTVMALVHTYEGELPEARAKLYEKSVNILLWRWEHEKLKEQGGVPRLQALLREAGRGQDDLRTVLERLAFEVHGREIASPAPIGSPGSVNGPCSRRSPDSIPMKASTGPGRSWTLSRSARGS